MNDLEDLITHIDAFGDGVNEAYEHFKDSSLTLNELELLHHRVNNIFTTIRKNGVCKEDIDTLNELGLTDLESQYYTEHRTFTNIDPALEAAKDFDVKSIGVGALLAALVAVLIWLVGKFFKWLFSITDKFSKSSSSAQNKSAVKFTKGAKSVKINLKELKGRHRNLIAIISLGENYVNGSKIKELFDHIVEEQNVLPDILSELRRGEYLSEFKNKVIDSLGTTTNKKEAKDKFRSLINYSDDFIAYLDNVEPIIREIMGEKLNKGNDVFYENMDTKKKKYHTLTRQLEEYKGTELFADKHVKGRGEVEIALDPTLSELPITENIVKDFDKKLTDLKKEVDLLEKGNYGDGIQTALDDLIGDSGLFKDRKGEVYSCLRLYLQETIIYRVRFTQALISKVFSKLIVAHSAYGVFPDGITQSIR